MSCVHVWTTQAGCSLVDVDVDVCIGRRCLTLLKPCAQYVCDSAYAFDTIDSNFPLDFHNKRRERGGGRERICDMKSANDVSVVCRIEMPNAECLCICAVFFSICVWPMSLFISNLTTKSGNIFGCDHFDGITWYVKMRNVWQRR